MKKENYQNRGNPPRGRNPPPYVSAPICNSSNPCSHLLRGTDGHRQCSRHKWKKCTKEDDTFCDERLLKATKLSPTDRQIKICDSDPDSRRGWKWHDPALPDTDHYDL